MAFMAPPPDHGATYGGSLQLLRSLSIPALYRSTEMSPTDSLEKLMEGGTTATTATTVGGAGFSSSRSATTSPTGSYWGQDMVQMLQAGGAEQQLMGSRMVSSDWQQLLDTKQQSASGSYKYLPPVAMTTTTRGGIMENNARIREMMAGRNGWGVVDGGSITVDPSKGGLALQPAVGLATSHCLAQFTSDPAFAERAAKFSSFGNNNGPYLQIALPLPVSTSDKSRSSRSAESGGRLSRTSSTTQNNNNNNVNSGPAKKQLEMEETTTKASAAVLASATAAAAAAAGAASATAAAERSCDMDVDGTGLVMRTTTTTTTLIDDKSPPGAARVQPELEAIEGASLAGAMDTSTAVHELTVEAPAAREPTNSCSVEQQLQLQQAASVQRGGHGSISPAASPARSPSGSDDSDRRKRKNSPDVEPKAVDVVDSKPKRWRGEKGEKDDAKAKAERSSSDNSGDSSSPRAHKESTGSHKNHKDLSKQDYIHVRARRGQATDSHSLAERVRREKISERMKYLQDLVPGCSKVTGKAVMLDEIINYVQSLQRQVESLSMKLASVNPGPAAARLDYSFESALNKDLLQAQRLSGSSSLVGGPESTATFGMLQHQQQQQQQGNNNAMQLGGGHCGLDFRAMGASSSDGYLRRSNSAPINVPSGLTIVDTFGDDVSQSIGWDGELQSIVNPMGFGRQGRFGSSILDGLHSQLPVGHMKVEL